MIGIPSEVWGETPWAVAVLHDGRSADADEIRAWANARLDRMQRLAGVEIRPALPRSDIGKVLKQELRAAYWTPASMGHGALIVTMHDDLSGRVVVVTGASSGIGEATARLFAAHGATVVVGYHRDRAAAERVVAALPSGDHMAVQITIDEGASVRAAAETVAQRFGRTDVLVNSAGNTVMVPASDLDALTDDIFDQVTRTNLRGPFAVIRAFRPLLEKTTQGVVVNISSAAALTGVGSNLAYCAAKAGLDALTLALAKVLGPKIRILSVSPAAVDTDFVKGRDPERLRKIAEATPLRHVTTADDVARAVLACVTHLGSATGTTIIVDEGRHL